MIEGTDICPFCAAPVDIAEFAEVEFLLKPQLRRARAVMGCVAVMSGLSMLVATLVDGSWASIGAYALGALFFAGCFVASWRRPLLGSVPALALFIMGQTAYVAAGGPFRTIEGFLIEVILGVALATAVQAAYRIRDIRRQSRPYDRSVAWLIGGATIAAGVLVGRLGWGG